MTGPSSTWSPHTSHLTPTPSRCLRTASAPKTGYGVQRIENEMAWTAYERTNYPNSILQRQSDIRICSFLFFLFISNGAVAQTAPFDCDTTAYLFNGNPTRMYRLNLNSGVSQLVADPIISNPPNQALNAFGFNPADGHVWGYMFGTDQIVRIASDYSVTIFSIPGLPITSYQTGEISDNGIMYLYAGNVPDDVFYRVDLNLPSPQLILPNLSIIPTLFADWAFSPVDNNLYTIATNTVEVYRFDTSGNRTFVGNATGGGLNAAGYGGIFMDDDGNMYALNNNSGNIFKIDQPHTGNTTAILLSQGPLPTSYVDGASNFYAPKCPADHPYERHVNL